MIDRRAQHGREITLDASWRVRWLKLDEAAHPETKLLGEAAERFVKRAVLNDSTGPRLIVLAGRNGTGKTHTAGHCLRYFTAMSVTAWSRGWWGSPPSGAFVEWPMIAECVIADQSERLWHQSVWEQFLVLDDVGAESDRYKSGVAVANLAAMLNSRARRWTVITTNRPPEIWAQFFDKRVQDRLHRNSLVVELKHSPSYWQTSAAGK